ncbi:Nucleosome assembly protein 1;2, partial [Linum perenne]
QDSHDVLEAKYFNELDAVEAKYQLLFQPLYSQRYEIVNGTVEDGGDLIIVIRPLSELIWFTEKGVADFWLIALKSDEVLSPKINERDEGALQYLQDIRWNRVKGHKGFKLDFEFGTNPFFINSVLSKTYVVVKETEINTTIEKAIGTEIKWYPGMSLVVKDEETKTKKHKKTEEECESFFNFFNPPQDDKSLDDDAVEKLRKLMELDYEIGCHVREKIIPHAVSMYIEEEWSDLDDDDDNLDPMYILDDDSDMDVGEEGEHKSAAV